MLKNSISNFPLNFNIISSLVFDPTTLDPSKVISTRGSDIKVYIIADKKGGKFLIQPYEGVIYNLNKGQFNITFEGNKELVAKALYAIRYSAIKPLNEIFVNYFIEDYLNYNLDGEIMMD